MFGLHTKEIKYVANIAKCGATKSIALNIYHILWTFANIFSPLSPKETHLTLVNLLWRHLTSFNLCQSMVTSLNLSEIGSDWITWEEIRFNQIESDEIKLDLMRTFKITWDQMRPCEIRLDEIWPRSYNQMGLNDIRWHLLRLVETRCDDLRRDEMVSDKMG